MVLLNPPAHCHRYTHTYIDVAPEWLLLLPIWLSDWLWTTWGRSWRDWLGELHPEGATLGAFSIFFISISSWWIQRSGSRRSFWLPFLLLALWLALFLHKGNRPCRLNAAESTCWNPKLSFVILYGNHMMNSNLPFSRRWNILLSLLCCGTPGADQGHDDNHNHSDGCHGNHNDDQEVTVLLGCGAAMRGAHLTNGRFFESCQREK